MLCDALLTSRSLTCPSVAATAAKVPAKSPNDIVIVSALRTAIGRAKKGGFKE